MTKSGSRTVSVDTTDGVSDANMLGVKPTRVFFLTALAMLAFAANSLLCRAALKRMTIDAASFSSIRIISGGLILWVILLSRRRAISGAGSWLSASALFAYVIAFSFAYNSISAGTGALLLFAAVQTTMIVWGFSGGERFHLRQWIGFALASVGLVVLLLPGLSTPSVTGSLLMISAGIAWATYSIRGRAAGDPTRTTAGNFLRAVPMAAVLTIGAVPWMRIHPDGALYAVISGAITSGLGYVIWYAALPGLTATSAATVQLSAPVIAALGGILFLHESLTLRLLISSIAVLGGIALVVISPRSIEHWKLSVER
jgi:drug/metabolite transporter (DMT)-like permease